MNIVTRGAREERWSRIESLAAILLQAATKIERTS